MKTVKQVSDNTTRVTQSQSSNPKTNNEANRANSHQNTYNNKLVKTATSIIKLETVAKDIKSVLQDLRTNIQMMNKNDSYSDVQQQLEKMYLDPPKIKTISNQDNKQNIQQNKENKNGNRNVPQKQSAIKNGKITSNNAITTSKTSAVPKTTASTPKNTSAAISISRNSSKRSSPDPSFYLPVGNHALSILKEEVDRAIKERKTFTVKGVFPPVRKALLNRGWVEKFHITYRDRQNGEFRKFKNYSIPELLELMRNRDIMDICQRHIKSKLLKDHQVDFYWDYNYDAYKECSDKQKLTIINKFRRDVFSYTSKQGLCEATKSAYWYRIPGVAEINHPRTYSLTKNGDTKEFLKDFHITAAMGLLKWIVRNRVTHECKILSPAGKIPLKIFDFAITECYKFLKEAKHEDIDYDIPEATEYDWNEFLQMFYKAVHVGGHFKQENKTTEEEMERRATYILNGLKNHWPYIDMDGMMNVWILKPTNSSQGQGIHMCRTLSYILNVVKNNPNRRYIIQKYIEKPLLIYDTKFDIRQWFLISSSVPLTIWIYKSSYLRFSSQTYNIRKLHESIHLTNNSVQCKYKNPSRDVNLPNCNMWKSCEFKNYLSNIGYPNVFNEIIYPGMKQCITAAVLMTQDTIDKRRNCFELYGADFMITEDFKPWLLEINSSPALHASTPVTAFMCPRVLEDVIKVVVDKARNPNIKNTGDFELCYRAKMVTQPKPIQNLAVKGISIPEDYFYNPPSDNETKNPSEKTQKHSNPFENLKNIGEGMKYMLEKLLEILQKQKQKRLQRTNCSTDPIKLDMEDMSIQAPSDSKLEETAIQTTEQPQLKKLYSNTMEIQESLISNLNEEMILKLSKVPTEINNEVLNNEINAEKEKIYQLLCNLIDNAIGDID